MSSTGIRSIEKMTPEEKKQFEAGFDWTYFAAGLLMLPEGVILTGKIALSIGRFVVRMNAIQGIVNFSKTAEGGAAAAGEAARELEKTAMEAETAAKEAGAAGEAGVEVEEAASMLGRVSKFLRVLGAVGFVVTIIVGIIEIVEGAAQKTKLIEAIHGCQPARLCIAFFKREAMNIMQQLELLQTYLEASTSPDKDLDVAKYLCKKITSNIQTQNPAINWDTLEHELQTQDKEAGNFYGADDLPHEDVVNKALASNKAKN